MDRTKYGTPFLESEAMLAATLRDSEELDEVLEQMLPNERAMLADAAFYLYNYIYDNHETCDKAPAVERNDGHDNAG